MGATSTHFAAHELRCPHCHVNGATQGLVDALEALRAAVGRPIVLRSAYRCPTYNKTVGGAPRSQHMYGLAADLRDPLPYTLVRNLAVWSGIGTKDGRVVHVDARHLAPATNWTHGTVSHPTRWVY